jgi:phosphohistidine phosphatase SixA
MIVGHNPGISELARQLAGESATDGLVTAAVCSLTFDTTDWSKIGSGKLRDVMTETPPTGLFSLWA